MDVKKKFFDWKSFFLILFPFMVVFVFIPSELYFNNISEWGYDYYLLLYFAVTGLILAGFAYLTICAIAFILNIRLGDLAFWLLILGVFFLASDIFSPLQLGLLDGTTAGSDEPIVYTLIEISIFFLCVIGALYFSGETYRKWFVGLSVVSVFLFSGYFIFCVQSSKVDKIKNKDNARNISDVIKKETINGKIKPNIYHIVLDAMQTDFLLEVLKKEEYREKISGFYIFENNVSNYPYTKASSASYLSGTLYKGGSYNKWAAENSKNLFNMMSKNGYKVFVYAKSSVIHATNESIYTSQEDLLKSKSNMRHPLFKEFIRLWFARISPNFVTNEALILGAKLGDYFVSFVFDQDKGFLPKTIGEGIEPYSGVLMLNEVIDKESEKPANNIYVYIHPILPHGPYVFDDECKYNLNSSDDIKTKCLKQTECAIRLLIKFMEELKSLGKLDKSLIIVQSDHGSGWESNGFLQEASTNQNEEAFREQFGPWSKNCLEARAMAVLMIKPPGSRSESKILSAKSQTLDVYPTILDYAGISSEGSDPTALSLKECIADEICADIDKRERFFYLFQPAGPANNVYEKLSVKINEMGHTEFFNSESLKIIKALEKLEIGRSVVFSQKTDEDKYLIDGWSGLEKSHCWTDGKRATLRFKLESLPDNGLLFRMKAFPYLARGELDRQIVDFSVNGEKVAQWNMMKESWYEAKITKKIIGSDGVLNVVFDISHPASPAEFGHSSDNRKLGVGIRELIITEDEN